MAGSRTLYDAEKLKASGAAIGEVILFLRNSGMNKIASINAVRSLYGEPTRQAKSLVDHSEAWSDRFHSDVVLKSQAIDELRIGGAAGEGDSADE